MNSVIHWKVFKIYNYYRFLLIAILVFNFKIMQVTLLSRFLTTNLIGLFIFIYFLAVCGFFLCAKYKSLNFEKMIIFSTFFDLFFLNILILDLGAFNLSIGILLNISIAAVAIMLPGVIALFFAAFESILLLSYAYYYFNFFNSDLIYYAGLLGAGFFTTALTSLTLAKLIKASHALATKRKEEIISLQNLNESLIKKMQIAILFISSKRELLFMNDAAKSMFNIQDKCMPELLIDFSSELDLFLQEPSNIIENREGSIKLNGEYRVITIMPYTGNKNSPYVILIDDAKNLMQQAQQLKLASLGRFTASIAHELRNPLSAISHASQLLNESSNLTEQESRFNEIITKNCNRMNVLIKNVLQLSRQEKSKASMIDINAFLNKFISEHPNANVLNINYNNKAKGGMVSFDGSQLSQLLFILFDNAVKHGSVKGTKTTIIINSLINSFGQVVLKVADKGKGIPKAHLEDVFEPFYSTSRQGIGLGLFLAKELCLANKASIKVIKINNEMGACFEILFSSPKIKV